MIFEIGKQYIVSVTENRIIPIEEFSKERYFDIEHDSIDFLTDEEKEVIINDMLDKIKAEIKEWYWQADKQVLAKDPCVVDAMVDLFIRTIDKYEVKSEGAEE